MTQSTLGNNATLVNWSILFSYFMNFKVIPVRCEKVGISATSYTREFESRPSTVTHNNEHISDNSV